MNNEQHPSGASDLVPEGLVAKGRGVEELVLPLLVEEITVSRQKVEQGVVRVATVTRTREQQVDEQLAHEAVEVTRVPVGRIVETMPAIREEGDVTIMPVVEEIVVVERRLLLKEEVHVRRIRTTERHQQTITIREQEAVITRVPAATPAPATGRDLHDMPAASTQSFDPAIKEPSR